MPLAAIGYTAICAIAGIVAIAYSLHQKKRLRESDNWPQITGKIAKAEIVKVDGGDSTEYRVHVTYEFIVDGKRYTGERIEFSPRAYVRKKSAQGQLERFPIGSDIPVFFNPANPEDAVLLRSAPYNRLYLILGIAMLVLTVSLIAFSLAKG